MEGQGRDPETLVWQIRGKEKKEVEELWFKIKGRKKTTHTYGLFPPKSEKTEQKIKDQIHIGGDRRQSKDKLGAPRAGQLQHSCSNSVPALLEAAPPYTSGTCRKSASSELLKTRIPGMQISHIWMNFALYLVSSAWDEPMVGFSSCGLWKLWAHLSAHCQTQSTRLTLIQGHQQVMVQTKPDQMSCHGLTLPLALHPQQVRRHCLCWSE